MDEPVFALLTGLGGVGAGALIGWLVARTRAQTELAVREERLAGVTRERDELAAVREENTQLREALARAESAAVVLRRAEQEKAAFVGQASQQLRDAFQSLSADALRGNGQTFLELANQSLTQKQQAIASLVDPLRVSLKQMDDHIRELEKTRAGAQASLGAQIERVGQTQLLLQKETARLAGALSAPHSRGRWGELQLKRVVELAGMVGYCDFEEQALLPGEARQRPDLIVRLPGERSIVVDAKAPLDAYLQASAVVGAEREERLAAHARAVREHMRLLGSKAYARQLPRSPDFVLLFLPGEAFLAAALEQDPSLIEAGADLGVMLATPASLISILRAIAHSWREEQVQTNTREIMAAGRELHDRVRTLTDYFGELRRSISGSVDAFNRIVGTLEARVLPSARRLQTLGAGSDPIAEVIPLDKEPRAVAPVEDATLFSSSRLK
jgi:DNA recombination protein RmuC